MTVQLVDLVKEWLTSNNWDVLEVVSRHGEWFIQPKNWGTKDEVFLPQMTSTPFIPIRDDSVGHVKASDPEFFEKLDALLVKKHFHLAEWYQKKKNPGKPRKQIWP